MPSSVTRRTAFGVFGIAGISLLSACKGIAALYKPGTEQDPPANIPVPVAPAGIHERTAEGLYKFIGFFVAYYNYLLFTGDTSPWTEAGYTDSSPSNSTSRDSNDRWIISDTYAPLTVSIMDDMPFEGPKDNTYVWTMKLETDSAARLYDKTSHRSTNLNSLNGTDTENKGYFEYANGKWKILSSSSLPSSWSPGKTASF
ncbi:DUF6318 family protein [Rothia aeria]|uniref:DUF6318 family protein n=1 Tax=Rothia aeria TaxID=172042 RepID=UPI00241FA5CB|nr:DUF6318 family protein [Rothia aeria]